MNTSGTIEHRSFTIPTSHGALHAERWHSDGRVADARAPIVLFHDSLGCVALCRDFPARLAVATGCDVIAYDRLGFGRSDPHPGALSIGFIHEEAQQGFRALREALALDDVIAFGHSVGGGMAVGCAAAFPDACRALVTESAQAFVEDRTVAGILAAKQAFAPPGQVERLAKYHGDKAAWVLDAWIDSWLAPGFAHWTLDADLRRVICPTLAIHGDGDEYGSTRHPWRIVERVHRPATLRIMAGVGHVPHRECGEEVLSTVGAWLAPMLA